MIAADCAVVDDDVYGLYFIGINRKNFKRSSSPHAHKATAFHYSLLCQCEELGVPRSWADLFNFESLLGLVLLG